MFVSTSTGVNKLSNLFVSTSCRICLCQLVVEFVASTRFNAAFDTTNITQSYLTCHVLFAIQVCSFKFRCKARQNRVLATYVGQKYHTSLHLTLPQLIKAGNIIDKSVDFFRLTDPMTWASDRWSDDNTQLTAVSDHCRDHGHVISENNVEVRAREEGWLKT